MDRPLQALPVLTKARLMANFDQVVTDPAIRLEAVRDFAQAVPEQQRFLGRYWVSATSGSSGQPGFFLFNRNEWVTVLASFARAQEWAGARVSLLRRRKMATVASVSPWHVSSQVAETVRSRLIPSLRLAASDPLESIVQRLNDWQPDLLIAYASMARILAEEQLAGRLRIRPPTVYTSSEVLTDETRRRVAAAWGQAPFNQYASTETACIAAECQEGRRLHLFEDLVIVEAVDSEHRPVPPGEYGDRLLVTVLFNHTQPLIRYELNDSVRLVDKPCPCGRPFRQVESVQGRVEDTLMMPAARGGQVAIRPLVFNRIMDLLPVSGWQVIQEADDGLTVLLSGARDGVSEAAVMTALSRALAENGASVPRLDVKRVPAIPKTAAGKAPLIRARSSHPAPDPVN
jgi:putative adenylate-forming enzyme